MSDDATKQERDQEFLTRYLAIQPALRSFLSTMVGGAADVDDVIQEVSLALMSSYDSYDRSRPFIGWALGVARNHAARWHRGRWSSARRFSPAAEAALAVAYQEVEDELSERRGALRSCVERLGSESRELLRLRYE